MARLVFALQFMEIFAGKNVVLVAQIGCLSQWHERAADLLGQAVRPSV